MLKKEAILAELKKISKLKTLGDEIEEGEDVCVDDYSGGNVDDAYDKGFTDGQVELARLILKNLINN